MNRTDAEGYSTKVTALARGFGVRVLRRGVVVSEGWAENKRQVSTVLRELLRWVDKMGSPSSVASASRDRGKR
jgi:hypothetical protein